MTYIYNILHISMEYRNLITPLLLNCIVGFSFHHPLAVAVGQDEYVFVTDMHRLIMISPSNLVELGNAVVIAGSTRKYLYSEYLVIISV